VDTFTTGPASSAIQTHGPAFSCLSRSQGSPPSCHPAYLGHKRHCSSRRTLRPLEPLICSSTCQTRGKSFPVIPHFPCDFSPLKLGHLMTNWATAPSLVARCSVPPSFPSGASSLGRVYGNWATAAAGQCYLCHPSAQVCQHHHCPSSCASPSRVLLYAPNCPH